MLPFLGCNFPQYEVNEMLGVPGEREMGIMAVGDLQRGEQGM